MTSYKSIIKVIEEYTKDGNYPRYIHHQISSGIKEFNENYGLYKDESDQLENWMNDLLNGRNLWIENGEESKEVRNGLADLKELNRNYDNMAERLDQLDKNIDKYLNYSKLSPTDREELERAITNSYAEIRNNEGLISHYIDLMEKHLDKMNPTLPEDTTYSYKFYGRQEEYLQTARGNTAPYRKLKNNLAKAIDKLQIPIDDLTTETGYIQDYPDYPETYWEYR